MNKLTLLIRKMKLSFLFAFIVFLILFSTIFITFTGIFILQYFDIIRRTNADHLHLYLFAAACLVVGTILAFFFSSKPLKPIREIMAATDRIAAGDYEARIHLKGSDDFVKLNQSFNHMAEELGSIEMLRTDFVNNFSHEIKTPLVSIRGFAKLLKRPDLSSNERNEYLDIISSESERLVALATNILYLSKVEQQSIVTNKKYVNLSEQIRLCVVLLESKWLEKQLELNLELDELSFLGNEELMQQAWINLLDNAIKFSVEGGQINIGNHGKIIYFRNQCESITKETRLRLFDKFYQQDRSHTKSGNGIGLTLTKKIIELHGGMINVGFSEPTEITLEVTLPVETKK